MHTSFHKDFRGIPPTAYVPNITRTRLYVHCTSCMFYSSTEPARYYAWVQKQRKARLHSLHRCGLEDTVHLLERYFWNSDINTFYFSFWVYMCTDVIHHERTGYWAFICFCPGFVVYPIKYNSYCMGSSLFSAFNTANLCFLVFL